MAQLSRADQVAALGRMIAALDPRPAPHFDAFAALFHGKSLRKGEVFVRAGETSDSVALVNSGIARMFYTRRDGKEFNKAFVSAPDFMSVLEALITGEPARLTIQALTPMQLFVAPYARLGAFCERDAYWERVCRRIVERVYLKKVRREASLLMDTAADRYRAFIAEHGAVASRVPDYHIAAYLGITPEALSRLKRAATRPAAS
ncbi:Crp/Fnr family transcriptional regulator [Sorangium sp. So ce1335]|uniref:Crp/Fnr family transcriptional regulator n=1 Tax=Sorangium sp. So ce1335 TaxID=3133335 RepID=UPI003F5D884F